MNETVTDLGWWVIHGDSILEMLRRVQGGESPDVVYAEAWLESDVESYEGDE